MARKRKGDPVSGWAVIDKPEGPTSTDVVNAVKRGLNAQKAGHAGTLDPLASGLLVVALGEATKVINHVTDAPKTYRFTAHWGTARSTDDREGEIVEESPVRPDEEGILDVMPRFVGTIEQVPPAYSAIKVDGARAYDLARAGETVELTARQVHVQELALIDMPGPDHAVFEMICGKGTYVRSLVRDMARALGTCGHVSEIRRTHTARFTEDDAIPLEEWRELVHKGEALECVAPVETALDDIPALAVTGQDATRLRNGQSILLRDNDVLARVKAVSSQGTDIVSGSGGSGLDAAVLCSLKGRPVALCRYDKGSLQPVRVFNLPQ